MRKIYSFLGLVIGLLLFGGCQKEEVGYYEGGDRVQFKKLSSNPAIKYNENLAFSFAGKGALAAYDFVLPVSLIGRVVGEDRPIAVEVVADKSNVIEGVDFKLGPALMLANSNEGYVRVTLLNTAALETEVKKISLKIVESAAFKPGIADQLHSSISYYNFMVKPVDWDAKMRLYFGDYSKVKHEFILFQLGIPEINFANAVPEDKDNYIYSGTTLAYFQLRLRSMLNDLNDKLIVPKENDPFSYPLKDERGNAVVFP